MNFNINVSAYENKQDEKVFDIKYFSSSHS
jgi:hypothetical protein